MSQNHSIELEQRVLETLMLFADGNNESVQKAMLTLGTDCFYWHDNAMLFGMIKNEFQKQASFGFVEMLILIPKQDIELHQTLQQIIENHGRMPSGLHRFEADVERLVLLARLRKQLSVAKNMLQDVKECPSPEEAQALLIKHINDISNLNYQQAKSGITYDKITQMFYDEELEKDLVIPTTCASLNSALNGGIMSKSLITIAAGAGVGKTGFSIFLMDAIARNQLEKQCLFFSLEMEYKHIWMRHISILGKKKFDKLLGEDIYQAIYKAQQVPTTVYDSSVSPNAADIDFILTTARLKAMEKPVSVIVVDYLGLVQNKGKFERHDLKQADITSKLAGLAIELNCVVIALSQINRGAAMRSKDDQCPWPQDAADSSGSYRSSTLWLGVDRPELYQDDIAFHNQFVVKCRKNRFGGMFELLIEFNEGTFGKVSQGYINKPKTSFKSIQETVLNRYGDDY